LFARQKPTYSGQVLVAVNLPSDSPVDGYFAREKIALKASITLAIVARWDRNSKQISHVHLDLKSSKVLWNGVAPGSDVDAYDGKQRGTNLKILRAFIAHKLGQSEYYGYLANIWERQTNKKPKQCNKNVRKLFGVKTNGEGRFVDLFDILSNHEMIVRDVIEDVTIQIREDGSRYEKASDSAMLAILRGIETSTGTFIPQSFEGTLTTDLIDRRSIETIGSEAKTKPTKSPPITPKPPKTDDKDTIEHVFDNVIKEIKRILNRRQVLRQFIADSTTRFIENRAGHWCVTDEVKARGFKLEPILEGIVDRLDDFVGDRQEWKSLGEVAGGLAVLGLDRSWIARHIANSRTATAEFPAYDETIGVGDDKYVNLLHLVTCGLADGMARLEKLFGEPPLDDRRLPDSAVVYKGSMSSDIEKEITLFLIRNVLGRREKIVATNDTRVKIQFKQVKRKLATTFKNHVPFYGSSPQYRELADLIRTNLQVEDLLLIFQSGDDPDLDPEELVPNNMSVFEALGRIFDAVQANLGMQS
jgi:hypothetical protein